MAIYLLKAVEVGPELVRQSRTRHVQTAVSKFRMSATNSYSSVQPRCSAGPQRRAQSLAAAAICGPDGTISPARGPNTLPRLSATLATTGLSVLRLGASLPRSGDEDRAIQAVAERAGKALLTEGAWIDGWYRRDFSPILAQLTTVQNIQRERAGRLNFHSLLASPILGAELLLNRTGQVLRASDLPNLAIGARTVGEVVQIQWISSTTLCFRHKKADYPDPGDRSFRTLCDLQVMCYPDLLLPHETPDTLRLQLAVRPGVYTDVGEVATLRQAESLARRASGRSRLQFHPHPRLSPILPLWGSATRLSQKALRKSLQAGRQDRADIEHAARSARAYAASDIHRLAHSTSRQRLIFHKLKSQRLSGWDWTRQRRGCPHCPTAGPQGGDTFHVVWQCLAAQYIWATVRSWWDRLGLWHDRGRSTTAQLFQAIFSLRLPHTPPKAWDLASLHRSHPDDDDSAADSFPIFQAVWQQCVLESLVFLQAWRTRRSEDVW